MGDRRGPPNIDGLVTIKVDNIAYNTTADDVRRFFEKCGDIGDVYIPRDHRSLESRGFAFVRFYREKDAEYAIEDLDGRDFRGRQLRIEYAKRRRPEDMGGGGGGGGRDGGRGRDDRRRSRSRDRRRSPSPRRRSRSPRRRSRSPERRKERSRSRSPVARGGGDRSRSPRGRRSASPDARRRMDDKENDRDAPPMEDDKGYAKVGGGEDEHQQQHWDD